MFILNAVTVKKFKTTCLKFWFLQQVWKTFVLSHCFLHWKNIVTASIATFKNELFNTITAGWFQPESSSLHVS